MPLLSLKPLIIGTSILVGASLALYESHPQIRALIDSAAVRIVDMFEEVLDALDAQLRLLTPQQREERRRRQRERVRTAVLFDASTGRPVATHSSATPPAADIQMQSRGMDQSAASADQPAVGKASGVDIGAAGQASKSAPSARAADSDERKAKRRRLWEMSEPAFEKAPGDKTHVNDSAIDVADPPAQPSQAQVEVSSNLPDAPPPSPDEPAEREEAMDDAASDGASTSSFEAINTPVSGSPSALHSRAPSVTPSDFINEDELSSGFRSDDEGDGDEASTDTMSHVSGYSFASVSHEASGNQSETESLGDADVISIASSDDSEAMRA